MGCSATRLSETRSCVRFWRPCHRAGFRSAGAAPADDRSRAGQIRRRVNVGALFQDGTKADANAALSAKTVHRLTDLGSWRERLQGISCRSKFLRHALKNSVTFGRIAK